MNNIVLQVQGIHKSFGALKVLKNVHLNLYQGEAMALMGENGAGKSTLMKIVSGIENPDQGTMHYQGKNYTPSTVLDAEKQGIVVIHQELNLFDEMSVMDNVFLGDEILKKGMMIDYAEQLSQLTQLFTQLNIFIDPKMLVRDLSIGQKQLVEIVKALRKNAEILIMDEPTSALSEEEIANVFSAVEILKAKGVAVVYISHRMQEIYQICDRVTILRDGEYIGEHHLSELPQDKLIELMVGREISDPFPYCHVENQEEYLSVRNLQGEFIRDIDFTLKKGEILGVGGLMGSGRTTLAHTLYGLNQITSGVIEINNQAITLNSPKDALAHQIVYISEDRKGDGLFVNFSIKDNISMSSLKLMSNKVGQIDFAKQTKLCTMFSDMTKVKATSLDTIVSTLSGGNQQKVAIAKALLVGPRVLILDEPTRGIDIGARREIYTLINEFKAKGTAIILISSDLPELLALSDRVLVMSEGKMTGILSYDEKSPENVMKLAVNS